MRRIIFDTETDGLLAQLTKLHCLVLRNADNPKEVLSCTDADPSYTPLKVGLRLLAEAEEIIGHNILDFDLRAIRKVYPTWSTKARVRDTLILARVLWPEIKNGDFARVKAGKMPRACLAKPQSLKAWGYRLGVLKGTFGETSDWSTWSAEMQTYCEGDTDVTAALFRRCLAKNLDPVCEQLEYDVRELCTRITENGFPFDAALAQEVLSEVEKDLANTTALLQAAFPPLERRSVFIPKVNNGPRGYQKGVPIQRVKLEEFNPASAAHIAERFRDRYGWKPEKFTEGGEPQLDEDVLESMDYPEARLLLDYMLLAKRKGALVGRQGWLNLMRDGRVHGEYSTSGAVTGRATHSRPNIAQVTKKCPRYGKVFRRMFTVPPGWVLVGADMSGLELRCLAHYLAKFDDGAYIEAVTQGDVHTLNMTAAGLSTRDQAKTFIYAFLYGAGGWKLGHIVNPLWDDETKVREGEALKRRFLKNTPGLSKMRSAISAAVEERGFLIGVDGRPLTIRKAHAAVNTLLQSAGAILCKRWIVQVDQRLQAMGLRHGWNGDYAIVAWVHDELQIAARSPEIARIVAQVAAEETTIAGEFFGFKCPLAGEAKEGSNWSETH